MKIEFDLSDIALSYLNELSKEFEITQSEVISGLLVKYCLDNITKDIKVDQNPLNKQIKT